MENQIKENQEVEIDLGEIFHVLLGRLGIIILSGIVLALIAVVGTMLFINPQYESTTKIVVLSKQDNSTLTNQDMQTSTLLTKDYAELIKSRTVTEGVIAGLNLDLDHEELLKKISVENQTDTRIVAISVSDEDTVYGKSDCKCNPRCCICTHSGGYGCRCSKHSGSCKYSKRTGKSESCEKRNPWRCTWSCSFRNYYSGSLSFQ